jgi:hypothetical protein
MSTIYRGHSIDASYQVSVHLAKAVSEENIFRNQAILVSGWSISKNLL